MLMIIMTSMITNTTIIIIIITIIIIIITIPLASPFLASGNRSIFVPDRSTIWPLLSRRNGRPEISYSSGLQSVASRSNTTNRGRTLGRVR
jgi:hypothetical protein